MVAFSAEGGDKEARCVTCAGSQTSTAWETEGPAKGATEFGNGSATDAEKGIEAFMDHGHKAERWKQ